MYRDRRKQKLACRGRQRINAPRLAITQVCACEAVRAAPLPLTRYYSMIVSVIADENFVGCGIHEDAVRISDAGIRPLDVTQGLLVFRELPAIDLDSVRMLRGDEQFI